MPIIAELTKMEGKNIRNKVVTKRCMKNFTKENWNRSLARGEWEKINQTEDVNEMAAILKEQIIKSLDECAPMKKNHNLGFREETKKLMKEKESVRKKIGKSNELEGKEVQAECKRIRNTVTKRIRQDTINFNEEEIEKAGDGNELWKVVNDITNQEWKTFGSW